jgi:hypothetical protein
MEDMYYVTTNSKEKKNKKQKTSKTIFIVSTNFMYITLLEVQM